MLEPHIFCGPEFALESLAEYSHPLPLNVLLQLQTELYNLLTPAVRRKIHATYESGGDVNHAAAPPPPNRILFLEVRPTPADDTGAKDDARREERVETVQLLLLVTDSRAAAELFVICLKNPFIALQKGMRLRNRYTSGGVKLCAGPGEILRKKEALRSHMNLDEDLWATLQEALTPEWVRDIEMQYKQQQQQQDGTAQPLMRRAHHHEHRMESLLWYCEKHVHYVGVMDEAGKASPFLRAMGLFYNLGLTYRDALVHMVRHHRRTIRALALFIARYTAAPEDLEPFFAPSLTDEVVIACTEDLQVTSSMRQLCEDLLLRDEVCEAWPPTYHPHWIEHAIRPMMQRIEADCRRREELRQARERDGSALTASTSKGAAANDGAKGNAEVRGSGNGVGVFGFRNLNELQTYVREKQRVLVPQRVLSILTRPHHDDGDVDSDGDDEGDDDFLIKVGVKGDLEDDKDDDGGGGGGGGGGRNIAYHGRQQQPKLRRKRVRETAVMTANTRALVVTGAYRAVLRLLGRTEPFDKRGEHYLQF